MLANCLTAGVNIAVGVSGVKAVQWGIKMEATAIRQFEEQTGHEVSSTGLWLHSSGILGASPDGFIQTHNAVLEVKCPKSQNWVENIEKLIKFYCSEILAHLIGEV